MSKTNDSDSAEAFDPVAFAERWYNDIWPEKHPVDYQRYVQALKTLGRWEDDEGS